MAKPTVFIPAVGQLVVITGRAYTDAPPYVGDTTAAIRIENPHYCGHATGGPWVYAEWVGSERTLRLATCRPATVEEEAAWRLSRG